MTTTSCEEDAWLYISMALHEAIYELNPMWAMKAADNYSSAYRIGDTLIHFGAVLYESPKLAVPIRFIEGGEYEVWYEEEHIVIDIHEPDSFQKAASFVVESHKRDLLKINKAGTAKLWRKR